MKIKNALYSITLGFCATAFVHLFLPVSCKSLFGEVTPSEETVIIDMQGLDKSMQEVETAFLNENVTGVSNMLSLDAQERMKDVVPKLKPYLKDFGTAFKNRKLVFITPIYAEYSFDYNGRQVSVAFSRNDDAVWKMMRF